MKALRMKITEQLHWLISYAANTNEYVEVCEDHSRLLYLEQEYEVSREQALNRIAFSNRDYGIDGYHVDL